jgi:hypothetical protein
VSEPTKKTKIIISVIISIVLIGIITFAVVSGNIVNADTNETQQLKDKVAKLEQEIAYLNGTDNNIISFIEKGVIPAINTHTQQLNNTDQRLDLLEAKKVR